MRHVTRGLDLVSLPLEAFDLVHDLLESSSQRHSDLLDLAFDALSREVLAHLRIVKRRLGERIGPLDFPRH